LSEAAGIQGGSTTPHALAPAPVWCVVSRGSSGSVGGVSSITVTCWFWLVVLPLASVAT
jgi:hypothetical protein